MSYKVNQKVGKYIYVYEAESYWDKEKRQPRQHRKFLGRKDIISGEIVNTKVKDKSRPVKSLDFGNIYFLKEISTQLGIIDILKETIPDKYNEVLGLIYYTICEGEAYYLAEKWSEFNYLEIRPEEVSSQRISELLEKIGSTPDKRVNFFKKWIQRQQDIDAIYFDITSISTYAKLIDIAEWGYNRDLEKLRQINIGIVYGSKSELPLYYKIYPGSITDVTTLSNIKRYNEEYGIKEVIYILDRGFYSKSNIEELKGEKVIIPLPFSTAIAVKLVEAYDEELNNMKNMFIYQEKIYIMIKDKIKIGDKDFEVYLYRNKQLYNEEEILFYKIIIEIEEKVNSGNYTTKKGIIQAIEGTIEGYSKYFKIMKEGNIYRIRKDQLAIEKQKMKFGTFILLTNVPKQSKIKVLEIYKQKERIEKIFDCMKNELDKDRLRVHTVERAQGVVFITYLSLILTCYIEKMIRRNELLRKYTKKEIIYELKKLKLTQFANGLNIVNEMTKKVKDLFKIFNINTSTLIT